MFTQSTGSKFVPVRHGFTQCDVYGRGFIATIDGNLDAPDYILQGSVRLHCTGKPNPQQSVAHRDHGVCLPIGAMHDGIETAATVTHWANT